MPYATNQDMLDEFGEREVIALTDRDNQGEIDAALLSRKLVDASALIDSYLVGRYPLPLTGSFPVLKRYACDITRYLLSGTEVAEVETVRNRYKDAIRFLESVRDGKIKFGADQAGHAAPEPARISVVGGDRTFTAGTLADFVG